MGKIENVYRTRRRVLYGAFFFSILSSLFILSPYFFSWLMNDINNKQSARISFFWIGGTITFLIFLSLIIRYFHLRISMMKNTSLIQAVDDERIRISWLKAFRFTFYLMVSIQCIQLSHLIDIGYPLIQWLVMALGLPALFGAALYFSREGKHDGQR